MLSTPRKYLATGATLALLALGTPVLAEGPTLLTITGSVENANRGAVDPEFDKLFSFNDISFDRAMEVDRETLLKLPQVTVKTDFPKGGEMVEFTGPTVEDVLKLAGAEGDTVTIQAMDGYAVDIPMSELIGKGGVVALSRDGRDFGIGNFGPTQIVFPRAERADLADMPDDWWVWQIYHISVD